MRKTTLLRSTAAQKRQALEAYRKKLGKILRQWRTEAGMSRPDLVRVVKKGGLSLSVATVLRWEEGTADIRVLHLEHLERVKPGLVAMVFERPRIRDLSA